MDVWEHEQMGDEELRALAEGLPGSPEEAELVQWVLELTLSEDPAVLETALRRLERVAGSDLRRSPAIRLLVLVLDARGALHAHECVEIVDEDGARILAALAETGSAQSVEAVSRTSQLSPERVAFKLARLRAAGFVADSRRFSDCRFFTKEWFLTSSGRLTWSVVQDP